jgi:hypothetical protein
MKFEIVLLVLSISYAIAQKPCVTPVQWEGRIYESDDNRGFRSAGNFSYDSTGKQTRFIDEVRDGRFEDVFDVLRLWNQKIEYRFDLRRKFCTKNPLNEPWVNKFSRIFQTKAIIIIIVFFKDRLWCTSQCNFC